jgi:hypothetical protein
MHIVAIHEISDPETFWGAAEGMDLPEGTTLHSAIPNEDGTRAVCVWECLLRRFPAATPFRLPDPPLPPRALSLPEKPRTCPRTHPQERPYRRRRPPRGKR